MARPATKPVCLLDRTLPLASPHPPHTGGMGPPSVLGSGSASPALPVSPHFTLRISFQVTPCSLLLTTGAGSVGFYYCVQYREISYSALLLTISIWRSSNTLIPMVEFQALEIDAVALSQWLWDTGLLDSGDNTPRVYESSIKFDSKSSSCLHHGILVNHGKETVRLSRVERHWCPR